MKLFKDSENENLIGVELEEPMVNEDFDLFSEYLPPAEALIIGSRLVKWATERIEAIESEDEE